MIKRRNFGTYIQVDTITKNNKNYLNQQHQQLVSYLSLRFERFFQQLARQSKAPQKVTNFFGDPALPAALKINTKCQQAYKSPNN